MTDSKVAIPILTGFFPIPSLFFKSLHNRHIENHLVLDVLLKHYDLAELNNIVYCWLPSHVEIEGNEKDNIAATNSLVEISFHVIRLRIAVDMIHSMT